MELRLDLARLAEAVATPGREIVRPDAFNYTSQTVDFSQVPMSPVLVRDGQSSTGLEGDLRSVEEWGEALGDKDLRAAIDRGIEDLQAGRTKPWSEISSRLG